jgi:hypothetical protein
MAKGLWYTIPRLQDRGLGLPKSHVVAHRQYLEICFSPYLVVQVRQSIAPVQDIEQLRKFLRQVAQMSNEEEVLA